MATDNQSLRGFIEDLERALPAEVLRIKDPVNQNFEMTSTIMELDRLNKSPVVIFENVAGFDMPVVTNTAANRGLLARCLNTSVKELPSVFRERCQNYIPPEIVPRGAWDEIVLEGDDIDLTKLPIPLQFSVDAAPYITAGQVTARDPETGIDTTGFHRLMLKGKNRLGISLHSRRRMFEFHRRAEARGENLPAAIVLGVHPLHYMGSMVYAYPPNVRKFDIIGGLFGEPYRLARCGIADLEVPANAEIIIEGEILANVHEPEGPFGEFTGYASYRSTQNVFVVKRIRMQRKAYFHSITAGMARDHILISCITREGEILNALRRNIPNVKEVHVPHTTCGAFLAIVSIKKVSEGEAKMAMLSTLGTELYTKSVIVVDDDVNIFDMDDVMWAVATRSRAEKDIMMVPGVKSAIIDPTSDTKNFTITKWGIDATAPLDEKFAERLTISEEHRSRALEILSRAKVI